MTVCVSVKCGSFLRETTVNLSLANGTVKGHCINIINAWMRTYSYLCTGGIDFVATDSRHLGITLSNLTIRNCATIMTRFDNHLSDMDEQFQVLLPERAESGSAIYMPDTANITIINCMSIMYHYNNRISLAIRFNNYCSSSSNNHPISEETEHWENC